MAIIRSAGKKWTIEKVKAGIKEVHGDTISIDESTYSGMEKRCKFIDVKYGEWWTRPSNIIHKKQGHKKRGPEKAKQTCKTKYGVENFNQLERRRAVYSQRHSKYTMDDIKEWVVLYNKYLSTGEVARQTGVNQSVITEKLNKYKDKLNIKFKEDIQKELFEKGERLCLPLTGCGRIKKLEEFYFRKDSRKYKEQCGSCRKEYQKKWNDNNVEYRVKYDKEYRSKNRDKILAYRLKRKKEDINFRLLLNVRTRISNALKGQIKHATAIEYLGCSVEDLKSHLEEQFYPNPETGEKMTWDNYGFYGWHIDHITPLASFNLTDREQLLEAGCYTNLQPLWAKENISKGAKTN